MRRGFTVLALLLLFVVAAFHAGGPTVLTADQWRADLAFLRDAMERMHPNPYFRQPKAAFDEQYKALYDHLPQMDDQQIAVGVIALIAGIGDGHTWAVAADPKLGFTRIYPFRTYLFDDGLFIVSASAEHADLVGARILEYGVMPWKDAVEKAKTILRYDNEFTRIASAPFILLQPPMTRVLGISDNADSIHLKIRDRSGDFRDVTVNALPEGSYKRDGSAWAFATNFGLPGVKTVVMNAASGQAPPLAWKDLQDPYWFEYLPRNKTVYFQFNRVSKSNPKNGESFEAFCDRLFTAIEANGAERLIIDLRWNGGGDNSILLPLIHGLICNKTVNRDGHLFAILGRETFSAAMSCAGMLEKHTHVTFAGEPPGSRPNHYGDNKSVTLPNSGMIAAFSSVWWMDTNALDKREFIVPHILVKLTSQDFAANRDPVVDAILARP